MNNTPPQSRAVRRQPSAQALPRTEPASTRLGPATPSGQRGRASRGADECQAAGSAGRVQRLDGRGRSPAVDTADIAGRRSARRARAGQGVGRCGPGILGEDGPVRGRLGDDHAGVRHGVAALERRNRGVRPDALQIGSAVRPPRYRPIRIRCLAAAGTANSAASATGIPRRRNEENRLVIELPRNMSLRCADPAHAARARAVTRRHLETTSSQGKSTTAEGNPARGAEHP